MYETRITIGQKNKKVGQETIKEADDEEDLEE
jgi:hypothetical protein